jgi:hypothetical protein
VVKFSIKIIVLIILTNNVFCNMGPQGFKDFLNYYFVETGSYLGSGIQKASNDGFNEIYSIEAVQQLFNIVSGKFINDKNVHLYFGDSSKDLWNVIKDLNKPITFWLDAHICPARQDGGKNCPLIEELEQIGRHHIKNHTILIDDMHCADTILFDFLSKDDLKEAIWKINPNYKIFYVPGGDEGEYSQNVMVALIE